MIDISKIKLIIWDLDETFWKGTLSEDSVSVPEEMHKFMDNTLDMGIVHSICSKNDFEQAKDKLVALNLWDKFVFPSIDWNPKGTRVKNIIEKMALRPANVLFIDDNIQNLKEASFFCNDIMTAHPEDIIPLMNEAKVAEKKDKSHKRLKQYRILETKDNVRGHYNSNVDFLKSCSIKVSMESDCIGELDRIHELLMRSNQLNYTKLRQSKDELKNIIIDNTIQTGIVKVKDKYGDYGIVGFYAVKDGKASHYFFSCRTLGMLVEQYVYKKLGCPEIDVVGDTVTVLNKDDLPSWINNEDGDEDKTDKKEINHKILFKGPCDMLQIFAFIHKSENIVTEFTYTNNQGILVEGHNHTGSIVTSLCASEEKKAKLLSEFSWLDSEMLTTTIGNGKYDYIFLSMLTDGNLGLYRRKGTDEMIALCESYYSLTNSDNINGYVNGDIYGSNIKFKEDELRDFSEKYEFVDNSDAEVTLNNLKKIYDFIPKTTTLVLMLGSEKPCNRDKRLSYKNRHRIHSIFNEKISNWASDKDNIVLMKLGKYIDDDNDYVDSINHFTKKVYYSLAQDVVNIINKGSFELKMKGASSVTVQNIIDKIRRKLGRI